MEKTLTDSPTATVTRQEGLQARPVEQDATVARIPSRKGGGDVQKIRPKKKRHRRGKPNTYY